MANQRPHQRLTKVASIKLTPAPPCELCGEKTYYLTTITVEIEGEKGLHDIRVCDACLEELEDDYRSRQGDE